MNKVQFLKGENFFHIKLAINSFSQIRCIIKLERMESTKNKKKQEKNKQKNIVFSLKSKWSLDDIKQWNQNILDLRDIILTRRDKYTSVADLPLTYRMDIDLDQNQEVLINHSNLKNKLDNSRYLLITINIISLYPFRDFESIPKVLKLDKKKDIVEYIPNQKIQYKKGLISITSMLNQTKQLEDYFHYSKWKSNESNLSQVCGILIAQQIRFNIFEQFTKYAQTNKVKQLSFQQIIGSINKGLKLYHKNWQDNSNHTILVMYDILMKEKNEWLETAIVLEKKSKPQTRYQKINLPLIQQFLKRTTAYTRQNPIKLSGKDQMKLLYLTDFIGKLQNI